MSRQFYFSDQQETHPAFVLNVPNIPAVEPAVPLLTYAMPCSAPRSSGRFDERLSEALDRWIMGNRLPCRHCWSVAVRCYSDLGGATAMDQPPLLALRDVRIPVADTGELNEPEAQ